ncbi:hypothetical protein SAMN05443572_114262 [Myxococcus fulvus]|uniref:Lipoprotein n=1 Tax=Myxococcus fulvus TaxID=33 RepID=A0A511TCS5_MYXFU|nr:hypothetical protein [Myxococcus fulvus]GEN11413.1 hypothetical protein MFU01_64500 [Myxococcus fulvus]SEU39986.1 hypothetical protein SAMN05443572_114262 [Myxococcus fulvus]
MRPLLLPLLALVSSCSRHPGARTALPQEDLSVSFPEALAGPATARQSEAQPAVVDGETLRALSIAANDFLPMDARERSCWNRQESYRYRVLKQSEVFFVSISADPEACRPEPRMLDGGARYAISIEGRILRRHFDGEPEAPSNPPPSPDAGSPVSSPDADIPVGDTTWGAPTESVPSSWLDGGTPSPSSTDGGMPR